LPLDQANFAGSNAPWMTQITPELAKISTIHRPFKKEESFLKGSSFLKGKSFLKSFLNGNRAHPLSNRDYQWIRLIETVRLRSR
jgi:hypothetical protein